jgi:hypothetical protein
MGGWSFSTPWMVCPHTEEGNSQQRPGDAKPQSKVVVQLEEVENRTTKGRPQILATSLESLGWGGHRADFIHIFRGLRFLNS